MANSKWQLFAKRFLQKKAVIFVVCENGKIDSLFVADGPPGHWMRNNVISGKTIFNCSYSRRLRRNGLNLEQCRDKGVSYLESRGFLEIKDENLERAYCGNDNESFELWDKLIRELMKRILGGGEKLRKSGDPKKFRKE